MGSKFVGRKVQVQARERTIIFVCSMAEVVRGKLTLYIPHHFRTFESEERTPRCIQHRFGKWFLLWEQVGNERDDDGDGEEAVQVGLYL